MLRPKRKITKREIRQDPLLETLFSIQNYYKTNKNRIYLMGGSLLGVFIIFLIISTVKTSSKTAATGMLVKSIASYNNGDYTAAIDEFDQLIAEYPNTPSGREALYFMGKAYISLENIAAAKLAFEEYQREGKNTFFLTSSLEALAGIAEKEERYSDAAELFQKASSIAEYSFNAQQDRINAATNWIRSGEYGRAEKILGDLQLIEAPHRILKDQIDELSAHLKILSARTD